MGLKDTPLWAFRTPSSRPGANRGPHTGARRSLRVAPWTQAKFEGQDDSLGAVRDFQFGEDLADVLLDGAHAQQERGGNLLVGPSLRKQPQNLELSR